MPIGRRSAGLGGGLLHALFPDGCAAVSGTARSQESNCIHVDATARFSDLQNETETDAGLSVAREQERKRTRATTATSMIALMPTYDCQKRQGRRSGAKPWPRFQLLAARSNR